MTTIVADIRDSLGVPLTGFIRITLDYALSDLTEDTDYITVPAQVALVTGQATFDLEASESQRITYRFEVYRTQAGQDPQSFLDFRAVVPASLTPITFTSLTRQTGLVRDVMDSNLNAVTARLLADPDFWNRLQTDMFQDRGNYSETAWYRGGDLVVYGDELYRCKSQVSIRGINPSDEDSWFKWTFQGPTGTGTSGSDIPFGSHWNGQLAPPTKNAIYNQLIQLATPGALAAKADLEGATLTNAAITNVYGFNENSSRIVSAAWVQAILADVRRAVNPVGILAPWLTGSPPEFWIILDGRNVSRTTYAALFAVWGTFFGAGDGSTTFTLPDYRGRGFFMSDWSNAMGTANRLPGVVVGNTGGLSRVTLTVNTMPNHTHVAPGPAGSFWSQVASGGNQTVSLTPGTASQLVNPQSVGGGEPHENMPPYLACNVIAYAGV